MAQHLNEDFLAAISRELETGEYDEGDILGEDGPTWFRPYPWNELFPLAGVRQVVGHTPPVQELEDVDFHMVDPCVFRWLENVPRFRYAVIEEGRVRVEEGTLGGACTDDGVAE